MVSELIVPPGPQLIVAGGFFDSSCTIVELLETPCLMLEDITGFRQRELARLLYALRKGLDDLTK